MHHSWIKSINKKLQLKDIKLLNGSICGRRKGLNLLKILFYSIIKICDSKNVFRIPSFRSKTEQSYCFLGDSINPSSRLSPFKNDAWNITIFHNDNEEIFRDPLMTGNSWSAFVMPGCRNIFHNLPNFTSSKHKLAKNPLIWAPQSTCYTNHSSCCCTLGELDFFISRSQVLRIGLSGEIFSHSDSLPITSVCNLSSNSVALD